MTGPKPLEYGQYYHIYNYAKAMNNGYDRTGSLFQNPFGRIPVTSEEYFVYIHQNPQKHGLIDDFRQWPYSSYPSMLSLQPTRLQRAEVLDWFQGRGAFQDTHQLLVGQAQIAPLAPEDFD